MVQEELPLKCQKCRKSFAAEYHRKCDTCRQMEFEESVFCELNRAVQNLDGFECHSFEPRLEIVNHVKTESGEHSPEVHQDKGISYSEILNSDKIKYERALAIQRLKRDPDAVYIQLKYHIAWNVINRTPVFRDNTELIESLIDLFNESSTVVNDFVYPIFLAPDHVHLLVESDGQLSIQEIINRIKDFTSKGLFNRFPVLKKRSPANSIWDDAYFVETLS